MRSLIIKELAGAQQVAADPLPDPWAPELSTQHASALLDRLTPLKKNVETDRRGVVHVRRQSALHGVPRPDVSLNGEVIVFSGFRDETLAEQIETTGGRVEESLTKSRTTRLLTWNVDGSPTTKTRSAQKYGKPIEHRADFVRRFYQ